MKDRYLTNPKDRHKNIDKSISEALPASEKIPMPPIIKEVKITKFQDMSKMVAITMHDFDAKNLDHWAMPDQPNVAYVHINDLIACWKRHNR